jgi:hypothetical protein
MAKKYIRIQFAYALTIIIQFWVDNYDFKNCFELIFLIICYKSFDFNVSRVSWKVS